MRLGSFQWNEASFSFLLWILIFGLKSVAAKAATTATVPTPLKFRVRLELDILDSHTAHSTTNETWTRQSDRNESKT